MGTKEYKEFIKRYDKFKKNNLPTPFWDDERETFEYVYYNDELTYWDNVFKSDDEVYDRKLNVNYNLIDALSDIAFTGFYYSYSIGSLENKNELEHTHSHSFESVVKSLYDFPETFTISKDEEQFFSKQELEYLRRVQKYLLFIGLKDIESYKEEDKNRYKNVSQRKYGIAYIHKYTDDTLKSFMEGKRNFIVIVTDHLESYKDYEEYPNHDRKELMVDVEDNFKLFVEYTHQEIKEYKDIKKVYNNKNLKDDDKVVVEYFKILEKF